MTSHSDVTVVTPVLNRLAMLREAVASVRRQSGVMRVEHVVVDGGSSDGTVEWVAAQPDLRLIQGPDHGVYDALNKGLAQATGRLIIFLNSDDVILPGALPAVLDRMSDRHAAAAGIGVLMDTELKLKLRVFNQPGEVVQDLSTLFLGHCALNSYVFRQAAIQRLGGFSLAHRLVSDRDFMIRFALAERDIVELGVETYCYRRHPGSLTFHLDETKQVLLRTELIALAVAWQASAAPTEAKKLARILEGRNRIGLLRLAAANPHHLSSMISAAFKPNALRAVDVMTRVCLDSIDLRERIFR